MIDDALYKSVEKLDEKMMRYIRIILMRDYVPMVKKAIMDDYDSLLIAPVTDRRSKTNPIFYRTEFANAIDEFPFLKGEETYTSFIMPDMDNFPFDKGKLLIIKNILEGVSGVYVEVNEEQYVAIMGKKAPQLEPYDKTVSSKERIYLLRYTTDVQRKEFQIYKRPTLVRYPFSNSPPIRLFDSAQKFVEESSTTWLETIVSKATKMYTKGEL
jgi:hypothetical protein